MSSKYKCSKCGKAIGIWTSLEYNKKRYCRKCWTEAVGWFTCSKCGEIIGIRKQRFKEKYYCLNCYLELEGKEEQGILTKVTPQDKIIKPI